MGKRKRTNGISPLGMEILACLPVNETDGLTCQEITGMVFGEPALCPTTPGRSASESKSMIRRELGALRKILAPLTGQGGRVAICCTHGRVKEGDPRANRMGYTLSRAARAVATDLLADWSKRWREQG